MSWTNNFSSFACQIEGTVLTVAGHDLIDGTPVLDIKPYIDEFDSAPDWRVPSWLPPREEAVKDFQLSWSPEALQLLAATPLSFYKPHEQQLFQDTLRDLLKLNPRSKVRRWLLIFCILTKFSTGLTLTGTIIT